MANAVFNYIKKLIANQEINFGTYPLYVALVNNSYSPDIDAHKYFGQFNGTYEIFGSGYTAGGDRKSVV